MPRRSPADDPRECGDVVDQERIVEIVCSDCRTVERIAVMGGEEVEVARLEVGLKLDRCREVAVYRGDRTLGMPPGELEGVRRIRSAPARRAR